jgi:Ca2+-binding RTX toxin-like protein
MTPLYLRALESRDPPSATVVDGVLRIEGTAGHDTVTVRYLGAFELAEVTSSTRIKGTTRTEVQYFAAPEIWRIEFRGYGGNDSFLNEFVLPFGGTVFADGGSGNDRLQTVSPFGASRLKPADSFPVELEGGPGDDRLIGGVGPDQLGGGPGDDVLHGFGGDDFLHGDEGNDILRGGGGSDDLYGDDGIDVLWGGEGNDILHGGAGLDGLFGEGGDDRAYGDDLAAPGEPTPPSGNDWLDGGDGADLLIGAGGNDWLQGGRGLDSLDGGAGNDRLDGGIDLAFDSITTGGGADTLVVHRYGSSSWRLEAHDDVHDFDRSRDRVVYADHV